MQNSDKNIRYCFIKIQDNILTLDKALNSLIKYEAPFCIIYKSYKLVKMVWFFLADPIMLLSLGDLADRREAHLVKLVKSFILGKYHPSMTASVEVQPENTYKLPIQDSAQ